jgi:uncharacterized membrane protein YagU involved in acid resistance
LGIVVPVLLIVVATAVHALVLSLLRDVPVGTSMLYQTAVQAVMHAVLVPLFNALTPEADR